MYYKYSKILYCIVLYCILSVTAFCKHLLLLIDVISVWFYQKYYPICQHWCNGIKFEYAGGVTTWTRSSVTA